VLGEYGEFCNDKFHSQISAKSIRDYFKNDFYNFMDIVAYSLLMIWVGYVFKKYFSLHNHLSDSDYDAAQGCLATSVVFLAIGLLRVFSINEDMGKLTIMIFAMAKQLGFFLVLFIICLVGFGVQHIALFKDDPSDKFNTMGQTFLNLFSAGLNNYDAYYVTDYTPGFRLQWLGIASKLVLVLFLGVVLTNLVIARMSATHDKEDEISFQEWQYTRAKVLKDLILIEERSPFSILPPPLNVLPILSSVLDYFYLHVYRNYWPEADVLKGVTNHREGASFTYVSYAGTVANWTIGFLVSLLAPLAELQQFLFRQRIRKRIGTSWSFAGDSASAWKEIFAILLVWPLYYPLYVLTLLQEVHSMKSVMTVTDSAYEDDVKYILEYERVTEFYENISSDFQLEGHRHQDEYVSIEVIRCDNLRRCTDESQPVVRCRIGRMQQETAYSIYGGKSPMFRKQKLKFPLHGVELRPPQEVEDSEVSEPEEYPHVNKEARHLFSVEVVDKDPNTLEELLVGELCAERADRTLDDEFREWIANGGFEGKRQLKIGTRFMGWVQMVLTVHFPSFLDDGIDEQKIADEIILSERQAALKSAAAAVGLESELQLPFATPTRTTHHQASDPGFHTPTESTRTPHQASNHTGFHTPTESHVRHVATLSESNKNRMVVSGGSNGSNGKNQDVDSLNGPQLNDSILQSMEGDIELLGEGEEQGEEQDEDKKRDKATASMVAEAEGSRGGVLNKEEAVEAIEAVDKKANTPVLGTYSNRSSSSRRVHTEQSQQLKIQTDAIQNVHVHSATNTPIHTSTHALTSPNSISSLYPTQHSSTVFPSRPAHSSSLPTHPSVPGVSEACRSTESHHGVVSGSSSSGYHKAGGLLKSLAMTLGLGRHSKVHTHAHSNDHEKAHHPGICKKI